MSTGRGRGSAQERSGTGGGGSPGWSGGCAALGGWGVGPSERRGSCAPGVRTPMPLGRGQPRGCCISRYPGGAARPGAPGLVPIPVPAVLRILVILCRWRSRSLGHSGAPGLVPVPVPVVLHIPVPQDWCWSQSRACCASRGRSASPVPPGRGGQQEGSLRLLVLVGSGLSPRGSFEAPSSAPFSLAGDTAQGRGRGHLKPGKRGPGCAGPAGASGQVPPPGASREPVVMRVPRSSSDVGERGRGAGSREPSRAGRDGHQP